jgi:hypothetical protein
MRVRIISFGTNWWSAHSRDLNDPLCFRRNAAWFNSAGLKYGRRLRLCWVFPGHIRFNQTSGFHPEYPLRSIGRTFHCSEPNYLHGRTHLLISTPANVSTPDCFLVTVNERMHGQISFASRAWRYDGVRPISVSLRGPRYEAMVLMTSNDWIETGLGRWVVGQDCRSLVLDVARQGGNA